MLRDLRYAVRILLRSPGLTLAAVGSLAFGIAANTALFTIVNSAFLRPLPYEQVEQLVEITNTRRVTPVDELRQARAFSGVAAYTVRNFPVPGPEGIRLVYGFRVSANLLSMLGVQPALGRLFAADEEQKSVAILSYEYWRRISGDPAIIGSQLKIDDDTRTIVGVLRPDFSLFVRDGNIFLPYRVTDGRTLARLNPGVSPQQAEAEVASILAALPRETGPARDQRAPDQRLVTPLTRAFLPNDGRPLLFLQVAVALVLLITCVNIANLLLVRASTRRREFAIRAAIGAGRAQVARQLLTESALLATAGGALGLLLASWSVDALGSLLPGNVSRVLRGADALAIDYRVLLFTLAATLLTALLCGFVPLRSALRFDVMTTLRDTSRGSGGGRQRLGSLLVAAEIALAVMLCVSAGLTLKSLAGLRSQNLGFSADHVLRAAVDFAPARYAQPQQRVAIFAELKKRLAAVPGVETVGLIAPQFFPFGGPAVRGAPFEIQGRTGSDQRAEVYFPNADYFRSVRIPLLRGRTFTGADTLVSTPVAILSQSVAQRYWGTDDPIGRQIRVDLARTDSPWLTIVGVVGDIRNPLALRDQPTIYRPFVQAPSTGGVFFIRTTTEPLAIATAVQRELRAIDPTAPELRLESLEKGVYNYVSPQRFSTSIFGFFAVLGLLLAGFGVYGVMRFWVAARVPEIGIRLAIGAQRGDVLRLILGRAARTAVIGLIAGLAGAIALQRLMASLLYGVSPTDPMVLASVAVVMAISALAAALGPAIWASRVDPLEALRHE